MNFRPIRFSESGGSKARHQHTVYSAQSSVTPCSCCLLPGYSHTCCEDLLRGATGCCSRVAGELVLCSPARAVRTTHYTGLSSQGGAHSDRSRKSGFRHIMFSETRLRNTKHAALNVQLGLAAPYELLPGS